MDDFYDGPLLGQRLLDRKPRTGYRDIFTKGSTPEFLPRLRDGAAAALIERR